LKLKNKKIGKIFNKLKAFGKKVSERIDLMSVTHKNPYLNKISDIYIDDNYICHIIQDYFSNGNLLDLIKKKKVTKDNLKNYLIQLCDGLDFLHENGIIHKNLKPQNIILGNIIYNL
jgi:serine/threonine protein kinase